MVYQKQKINKKFKLGACLVSFIFFFVLSSNVYAADINRENILTLLNQERAAYNLPKIQEDSDLDSAANLKAKDMINRSYFEHFAFGLTPWDFIKNAGYNYLYAGENLAMDFQTSEGMVGAWMNSPAHRENILNPDFRDVGIGIVKGEYTENNKTHSTIMVTNMFGRKKPAIVKAFDYFVKNILGTAF